MAAKYLVWHLVVIIMAHTGKTTGKWGEILTDFDPLNPLGWFLRWYSHFALSF